MISACRNWWTSSPATSSPVLRRLGRGMTPGGMRRAFGKVVARATGLRADLQLARLRTQSAGSLVRYRNYRIRINDGPSAYVGLKDIFVQRIYHFESRRANPLILDCGSNIGLSLLYFASTYPQSRIIAFEPDPTIFPCLQENMSSERDPQCASGSCRAVGRVRNDDLALRRRLWQLPRPARVVWRSASNLDA